MYSDQKTLIIKGEHVETKALLIKGEVLKLFVRMKGIAMNRSILRKVPKQQAVAKTRVI